MYNDTPRSLSQAAQQRLLVVSVTLAIVQTIVFQFIGQPLRTAAAPQGIISFEFAGTVANAQAMVASWVAAGSDVLALAGFNLGFDFLYPPVYATAIALSSLAIGRMYFPIIWLFNLSKGIAWSMVLAAVLDYTENVALVRLLLGATDAWLPTLAWWCATVKFAFVLFGIFYVVLGLLLSVFKNNFLPPVPPGA